MCGGGLPDPLGASMQFSSFHLRPLPESKARVNNVSRGMLVCGAPCSYEFLLKESIFILGIRLQPVYRVRS